MDLFTSLVWISWILVVCGWCVNLWISRQSARRGEINKTIDQLKSEIVEFEKDALDFWLNSESKIIEFQLVRSHSRIVSTIRNLNNRPELSEKYPSEHIAALRKAATLYENLSDRPESQYSLRIQKLVSSSEKLQNYYAKLE